MPFTNSIFIFAVALIFGVVGTALSRFLALKLKILDPPNPLIPQHIRPTPYLGGLGVAIGVISALFALMIAEQYWPEYFVETPQIPLYYFFGGGSFLLIGFLDDVLAFRPLVKFVLQVVAASLAVSLGLVYPISQIGVLNMLLSMMWILTIVNAVNFTDVCDGLVGGIAAITCLFLAIYADKPPELALAVAGAAAGFLALNFPPAKIFLGDAGSHFLGFMLAALALPVEGGRFWWPLVPSMVCFLGVPLFELTFITVMRVMKGLAWWRGSPDHFSLRMQAAGFSKRRTTLCAWFATVIFCAVGLLLPDSPHNVQFAMLMLLVAGLTLIWAWLSEHEVKNVKTVKDQKQFLALRKASGQN